MARREAIYKRMKDGKMDNASTVLIDALPELTIKDKAAHSVTFGTYSEKINNIPGDKYGDKKQTSTKPKGSPGGASVTVGKQGDSKFYRKDINGPYQIPKSKKER